MNQFERLDASTPCRYIIACNHRQAPSIFGLSSPVPQAAPPGCGALPPNSGAQGPEPSPPSPDIARTVAPPPRSSPECKKKYARVGLQHSHQRAVSQETSPTGHACIRFKRHRGSHGQSYCLQCPRLQSTQTARLTIHRLKYGWETQHSRSRGRDVSTPTD